MTTDKGPSGRPFCKRGLHEMTDDNGGANNGTRCRKCKRWNDQMNEDRKAGRPERDDPYTGTPYADVKSDASILRKEAAAQRARAMVNGGQALPATAPILQPAVSRATALRTRDPLAGTLPPEPTELEMPAVIVSKGYWSREVSGMADVKMLHKARLAHHNVCLYGPPGTGKTQFVQAAFNCGEEGDHDCGQCVEVIHGDGDTLVDDFVGGWQPTEREGMYDWCDGPLTRALRLGRPFFCDDFTLISPKVLAVLYPVMDGRGHIRVKGHTIDLPNGKRGLETVRAAEGFCVIGGHNPRVHGAILSDALRSRFVLHVHVPTSHDLLRQMGIDEDVIRLAENLTSMREVGEIDWVPQHRDLEQYMECVANYGRDMALANLVGKCPEEDRHLLVQRMSQVITGGQTVDPLALGGRWEK